MIRACLPLCLTDPPVSRTTIISKILTDSLSVYRKVIESGDYDFGALVVESGLQCPGCRTADCARYHGRWTRKLVRDLATGEVFTKLPILRARFCSGTTRSLFPAELWHGRATVTSVLQTVVHAVDGGLEHALRWAMAAGPGDEMVSERTARRWLKRAGDRVRVAEMSLGLAPPPAWPPAGKLQDFLSHLRGDHLLRLRRQWGHALLDLPTAPRPARTAVRPKPGRPDPVLPHEAPSRYLRRGTRCFPRRRGRPPDD